MCKYEEIEGWRLSNGKTIREIKNAVHEEVAHRHPGARRFQHAKIVVVIAEGHHILHRQPLVGHPLRQAFAFADRKSVV